MEKTKDLLYAYEVVLPGKRAGSQPWYHTIIYNRLQISWMLAYSSIRLAFSDIVALHHAILLVLDNKIPR